jgi:hypothetical protein
VNAPPFKCNLLAGFAKPTPTLPAVLEVLIPVVPPGINRLWEFTFATNSSAIIESNKVFMGVLVV